ncbi:hypothetical protein DFP74_4678 [Nocardiopsis sp. Huas11]|uniref:hypothetical protein n=1 Tax=Nocardiopsis sp. Huas11 TaxID=2183912 RepID=UPI000F0DD765|nr:hypothetical protein [Nocardiopsis sp. Huas11]RKS08952.1 hypothetical protein DFP74_4678 [Nocardiopsis sp. Huas11]
MSEQQQYARYREDVRVLAAIGACVDEQSRRVTVRLPRPLAEAAVAAWDRDEPDQAGEETAEEYAARDGAAELALIGLAVSERGRWEGAEVVVDLDVAAAGAAAQVARDAREAWEARGPGGTPSPPNTV